MILLFNPVVKTKYGNLRIYKITKEAYANYRSTVRDRDGATKKQARLLLSRNIFLAEGNGNYSIHLDGKNHIIYRYGNLHIKVDTGRNLIIDIQNHKGFKQDNFHVNKEKKVYLNTILGIE